MDRVKFTINGKKFSGIAPEHNSRRLASWFGLESGRQTRLKPTSAYDVLLGPLRGYLLAGGEFSANTTLNEFIRRHAEFRGTKYMCLEGGCGACIVNVRAVHTSTNELYTFSVNSCLVAIMSCDGWDITTVEGIGNRKKGYNVIQTRLNNFFGSQCGYCSPGFVMSMYSLVKGSDRHLTEAEIENSFGSNLCRCTGYRPILEAFKSFAANPRAEILNKIKDIEDINELVCTGL